MRVEDKEHLREEGKKGGSERKIKTEVKVS